MARAALLCLKPKAHAALRIALDPSGSFGLVGTRWMRTRDFPSLGVFWPDVQHLIAKDLLLFMI